MNLKQLDILGFKSFADKTVVKFHEGITAIVGPNGCGKSNIGDAIQWVLGEQSVKFLRGGKMPDVIFAGTDKRKPLPFAEVTILFDEVDGALNLPYKELSITRRLYTNGDSQFYINRQEVRLKDIQRLLFDSGIGKRNFSTFQQREIDAIIQQAPKERRAVFEEAAEINRFLHNRKETLRRLEEVDTNVGRIQDILCEVTKRVVQLKQQAEEAERFCQAKDRLQFLEIGTLKIRHESYKKKYSDLKEKEEKDKEQHRQSGEAKELLAKECERLKASCEKAEKIYADARESYIALKGARELNDHKLEESGKRLAEIRQAMEEIRKEQLHLSKERDSWQKEIEGLRRVVALQETDRDACKIKKERCEAECNAFEKEISNLRVKQNTLQQKRIEAIQREADLKAESSRQDLRLESNQEKKEQLKERQKALLALLNEKERELEERLAELEAAKEVAEVAKSALKSAEDNHKKIQEELEAAKKRAAEMEKRIAQVSARRHALQQLQHEGEGLSAGGKRLLQLSHQSKSSIFGLLQPLYEMIDTSACEQIKLQLVLKRYADTLVVRQGEDLLLVLEEAKKQGIAEFSLLCLEDIPDPKAVTAHFLNPIQTADTFEKALKHSEKEESFCDAGCLIDRRKVRFFGGVEKSSGFTRESEIRQLAEELLKIEKEASRLSEEILAWEQKKAESSDKLKGFDREHRAAEMSAAESAFAARKAQQDKERCTTESLQVSQEIDSIDKQIVSILARKGDVEKLLDEAKRGAEEIYRAFASIEGLSAEQTALYPQLKGSLDASFKELREKEEELKKNTHALSLLTFKAEEALRTLEKMDRDLKKALDQEKEIISLRRDVEAGSKNLHSLQEAEAKAEEAKMQLHQAKETSGARTKKWEETEQLYRQTEAKLHQTGIQMAHLETGLSSLERELSERFALQFDKVESITIPLETAEREMKKHKSFLESCPHVNLAAIDESREQTEREALLTSQLSDLVHSKEELLKLIQGIEGDCRKAFLETFAKIRTHFKKNFEILFQGGEADLELVQGEDPLEAGVEISAKPPGKQMRSLSLLSGGEKCLTAMALLFAIFEVKSSPFCLLDEIDAPLDDSNVERFVNMVRHYTDRSQFIIVTHNKRTMAIADRLYGVSMQEKGVSKLLSIEFSKEAEPQPVLC